MIYAQVNDFASSIPKEGKLLGLDYGEKCIGIATSDISRIIASPFEVYARRNISKDIGHITRLARENNIRGFVIGLPLDQNGLEGENCVKVRNFAAKLDKKLSLPIILYDERFSTAAVTRDMKDTGLKRKQRQEIDDKLAACYILQCVIDRLANGNK